MSTYVWVLLTFLQCGHMIDPQKLLSWFNMFNVNQHWANISYLLGRPKGDLQGGYRWFRVYSFVVSEFCFTSLCAIMAILGQNWARSRNYALLLSNDFNRSFEYIVTCTAINTLNLCLAVFIQTFIQLHKRCKKSMRWEDLESLRHAYDYREADLSANIVCTSYGISRRSCVHAPHDVEISRISCGVRSVLRYVQEMYRSYWTEYESFFITTGRL